MKTKSLRPLRRVLDTFQNQYGGQSERLECGHVIGRKMDHHGYTNAYRRRCRYCAAVHNAV
jgi:hypothetical protein